MQSQAADYYERVGRLYDSATKEWVGGISASLEQPVLADAAAGAQRLAAEELLQTAAADRREKLTVARTAVANMPDQMKEIISTIWADDSMNDAARVMLENERSFDSPTAALLTGIALNPAARARFAKGLDEWWGNDKLPRGPYFPEVIVGGGLHAAIYSAVRVAKGFPKPLVLERGRVGGAFAVTLEPSFILNSRNRPGDLSVPRQPGALNVLPGAPVQPSNLSNEEYQTNAQLAYVIRATLAMYAQVQPNWPVSDIYLPAYDDDGESVTLDSNQGEVYADRVILATGLNEPRDPFAKGERVMDWADYMRRKESNMFPLQGMRRVAVIGAGDGGKTVVEDLLGQGPQNGWSVATKDWVEQIGWYGVQEETRQDWERTARPRYRGIGRAFPDERTDNDRTSRITPMRAASQVVQGYNNVYVDGIPYDYAIVCVGYFPGSALGERVGGSSVYSVDGRPVARRNTSQVLTIGPAADLAVAEYEREALVGIPENTTALFRYASQTAALAASLS